MKNNNKNISKLVHKVNLPKTSRVGAFSIATYYVLNQLLTKDLLSAHIHHFFANLIKADRFYAMYIVIQYKDGIFKSLDKVSKVKNSELARFLNSLKKQLDFKDNQYLINELEAIQFYYKKNQKKGYTISCWSLAAPAAVALKRQGAAKADGENRWGGVQGSGRK